MAKFVINKTPLSLALSVLLLFAPYRIAFGRIVDKILAVVNDEVITQSELDRLLYPLYLQYAKIYKTEEEIYKRLDEQRIFILKELINDKLILSEAKRLEIKVEEKEIDKQLNLVKEDLLNKGIDLKDLLKEQNITLSDLRNKYRDQIMVQKTIDFKINSKINVQPSEISSYYHANIDDYTQSEEVAVYTILIKLKSKRSPLESRQLADDIYKMLLNGRSFTELAKNYSEGPNKEEGGDLGYVKRGQLLREIDNVIFFLKVGDISDVIETPIGYHIFKVYARKDEKILSLEEVRQQVAEALYRTKRQELLEKWLEKLKSDAYISIK